MKTIKDQNKLIAEFMGLPVMAMTRENYNNLSELDKKFCNGKLPENLAYHASWDWLMPVVIKIEEQNELIGTHILSTNINKTYRAVVKFIKQYNETK